MSALDDTTVWLDEYIRERAQTMPREDVVAVLVLGGIGELVPLLYCDHDSPPSLWGRRPAEHVIDRVLFGPDPTADENPDEVPDLLFRRADLRRVWRAAGAALRRDELAPGTDVPPVSVAQLTRELWALLDAEPRLGKAAAADAVIARHRGERVAVNANTLRRQPRPPDA